MRAITAAFCLWVTPLAGWAVESMAYFGVNPDLAAGAEALERGRFSEGVERTLAGLQVEVSPEQRASALNNLCAGYVGLRQYDVAIVHCSAALNLEPGSWHALNNRAIAYLGKGQLRLARRDVLMGLRLNPDSEKLQRVSGMVDEAASAPRDRQADPLT
jgi:tetratricopeptide (TPR) repeat protein